uniref:Tachykinin 1 n=1 Tax=Taeniopygia guttata TaxID=59729 RepID=A0A674HGY3_TAEGU
MRLPLAFAVLLLASSQALGEEMGATDDLSYWSDWSDSDQAKEELPLPLEHFLQRMARRPRPQQFFGLMGKRDAGYGQISHKKIKQQQVEEMHHTDAGYTKTLPSCAFAQISRNCTRVL